jgi:KamA family protein
MNNVLLSGGDPFVLRTEALTRIVEHLLPIPHLTSIRFGTRYPAYYPQRFADPTLPRLFEQMFAAGKTPVIVAHVDHVGETSVETERQVRRLREMGVQFLNQTVLLARVNDDPETLARTFERCHAIGMRPYYLFQARPVRGASHFQVPLAHGVQIVRQVNGRLSGIQKTFKFIMSHRTGKIEILGAADGRLYMRYIHNRRADEAGEFFSRRLVDGARWLDDLPEE